MTALAPTGLTAPAVSPLASLMAAVRTECRAVIVPPADHRLVDLGRCTVEGCPATADSAHRLCTAHADRWYRARRRGVTFEQWLPTCPPRCTPQACVVPGCRFGRHRQRLCLVHYAQWTAGGGSGSPTSNWATSTISTTDTATGRDPRVCLLPGCELWASFGDGFCVSHQGRLNAFRRRTGIRDPDAFLAAAALAERPHVDVTGLPPQLKLEVQYVLQAFLDNGPRRVNLARWNYPVRALRAHGATSLLDHTPDQWTTTFGLAKGNPDAKLFLHFGCDQVDRLFNGTGWTREYPLDTWVLDRVGHAAVGVARLTFASIEQDWLKDLVKQWTRHRLSVGINPSGAKGAVTILGRFSS